MLQHNLQQLLEQAAQLGEPDGVALGSPSTAAAAAAAAAGAEADESERLALQESIDRLAAALGEGNFFGGLLTLRAAAAGGQQEGVVQGWEDLEEIMLSGFASVLVAANGGAGGASVGVAAALREHDRCVPGGRVVSMQK